MATTIKTATKIRDGRYGPTYRLDLSDGRKVTVTVPPSACRACGGEGCKRCEKTDGYEPNEVR